MQTLSLLYGDASLKVYFLTWNIPPKGDNDSIWSGCVRHWRFNGAAAWTNRHSEWAGFSVLWALIRLSENRAQDGLSWALIYCGSAVKRLSCRSAQTICWRRLRQGYLIVLSPLFCKEWAACIWLTSSAPWWKPSCTYFPLCGPEGSMFSKVAPQPRPLRNNICASAKSRVIVWLRLTQPRIPQSGLRRWPRGLFILLSVKSLHRWFKSLSEKLPLVFLLWFLPTRCLYP